MMLQQNNTPQSHEEETDLKEQLAPYLKRWPWFATGLLLCLTAVFLYLHYATPLYHTIATLQIKDEQGRSGGPPEMAAFSNMGGLFGGMGTNSIENELEMFRSKRLITEVAKELNLNIRYFQDDLMPEKELFNKRPINIQVLTFDEAALSEIIEEEGENTPLFFNITSGTSYTVENRETGWKKEISFGESLSLPYAQISVTPNFTENRLSRNIDKGTIRVEFNTIENAATAYREEIDVNLTGKNSSHIQITLNDPVKDKAQQILDQLIYQYNREAIEDKNLVSANTANFIEDRLQIITRELDSVEIGKEHFKKKNQLTNIEEESKLFLTNASEFRKRQLEVETQLELANTMIDYLKNSDQDGLLPSNLGFQEEGVVSVIQSYNELILERDRIMAASTPLNPVIVNLNHQIRQIKENVLQSLNNLRTSLQIARNDLNAQEARIEGQISQVPSTEREFRNIERQQSIKEALYLFLLQKREETSLSLAVTAPKAKIVDAAYSVKDPVSPKPTILVLAALILGVLIPFLIIYVRNIMNNAIQDRTDIEKVTRDIPIIGEIPKLSRKESEMITTNDRSVLAESFRILHTNLQYLLAGVEEKETGNSIFVTSTIKGEGKTLVSFNFALTLANTGKKVLIVGADLRNPQLQRFEKEARQLRGVSDYLINNKLSLKELIAKSSFHSNLDMLASGTIPPNPSELWRSKKTATLFHELESMYDYVIVDTAPSLLVTDTFLINQYADLTLYVSRAGYTDKKLLRFAVDAKRDGKLKNVSFVLNAVETGNFGYGNKYGYAYGEETSSFWKKFRNRAAIW